MTLPKNEHGLEMFPDHDGYDRPLGMLRGDPVRMMAVPRYADANELIPESQVDSYDEWPSEVEIMDQDGRGACNPHSGIQGEHLVRYTQGMPYIKLSPWFTYSRLCRGRDTGSVILDCLEDLKTVGTCLDSEVEYANINPDRLSKQAYETAKRFKVEIGHQITTAEELWSAILRREAVNLAVCVGGNFNNLDSDGVAPLGISWCNHAVCGGFGIKRSRSGEILIKICNSWGKRWGQDGFFWEPAKRVVKAPAFEAYTLRAVIDDPQDSTLPPTLA